MNETLVCVVGNVATQPVYRDSPTGPTARFRLAVTARYRDREKNEWTDGHTNFFTVWARRSLATNVAASVAVGDPLVVQGRLKVRTEQRDGQGWLSADLDAAAIGHDLSRGTSAFRRSSRPEAHSGAQPGATPQSEPNWETEPARRPRTTDEPGAGAEAGAEAPAPLPSQPHSQPHSEAHAQPHSRSRSQPGPQVVGVT